MSKTLTNAHFLLSGLRQIRYMILNTTTFNYMRLLCCESGIAEC